MISIQSVATNWIVNLKLCMKSSFAKTVDDIKQNLSDYFRQIEDKVDSLSGETLIYSAPSPTSANISHDLVKIFHLQYISSVFSNEKDRDRR